MICVSHHCSYWLYHTCKLLNQSDLNSHCNPVQKADYNYIPLLTRTASYIVHYMNVHLIIYSCRHFSFILFLHLMKWSPKTCVIWVHSADQSLSWCSSYYNYKLWLLMINCFEKKLLIIMWTSIQTCCISNIIILYFLSLFLKSEELI